jgi:hypothetical protein
MVKVSGGNMEKYLEKAMTYSQYVKLIDDLLAEGKTTGTNHSEEMLGYGKLNRQRMSRLEKTIELGDDIRTSARNIRRKQIWLIITEGWCGDAAQNVPVIEKIAAESDKIETLYVLRDENLELMDKFLTKGVRAIPKLILLDAKTLEVLDTWGSRPGAAERRHADLKEIGLEKSEISEKLQRWYNEDRGRSLQDEFLEIIEATEQGPAARKSGGAAVGV